MTVVCQTLSYTRKLLPNLPTKVWYVIQWQDTPRGPPPKV